MNLDRVPINKRQYYKNKIFNMISVNFRNILSIFILLRDSTMI